MKSKELGALEKGLRALWERNKFVLLVIAAGAGTRPSGSRWWRG